MTRTIALAATLLAASTVQAGTFFIHDWQNEQPSSGDYLFRMTSVGSDPIEFTISTPVPNGLIDQHILIHEADAASYGFDWSELEALLSGPAAKTIAWGPVGNPAIHTGALNPEEFGPAAYYAEVDLDHLSIGGVGYEWSHWQSVGVSARGTFRVVAPEPSAAVLFGFGLAGHLITARRSRSPIARCTALRQ